MITLELSGDRNIHDIRIWLEDTVGWIIDYDNQGYFKGIGWTMKVIRHTRVSQTYAEIDIEFDDPAMETWFITRWL